MKGSFQTIPRAPALSSGSSSRLLPVREAPQGPDTTTPAPSAGTAAPFSRAELPGPLPCVYCHQIPCIGQRHHLFHILHYNDPREVTRRSVEATAVMLHMMNRHNRWR
jgi:hypothetical protein